MLQYRTAASARIHLHPPTSAHTHMDIARMDIARMDIARMDIARMDIDGYCLVV